MNMEFFQAGGQRMALSPAYDLLSWCRAAPNIYITESLRGSIVQTPGSVMSHILVSYILFITHLSNEQ